MARLLNHFILMADELLAGEPLGVTPHELLILEYQAGAKRSVIGRDGISVLSPYEEFFPAERCVGSHRLVLIPATWLEEADA